MTTPYRGMKLAYGWQAVDGKVVPHLAEQMTCWLIRARRTAGESYAQIANTLTARPRSGRRWYPAQIRRIVLDERTESYE